MSRGCPNNYEADCQCPRCACQRMDPEPILENNLRQIIYNVREEIGLRGDATAARFASLEKQLAAHRQDTDSNHDILEGRIEAIENARFVVFPTASGGFTVKSPSGELRGERHYRRVGSLDRRQAGFRYESRGRRLNDRSRYSNRLGDIKHGTRVAFDTRLWTRADGTKGSV
jgi:hypothetical protein